MKIKPIVPCLWFDRHAEQAARYYISIFRRNSRIVTVTRYGKAGEAITGGKPGSVLTVDFTLNGQRFTALNGGPRFKFNEAISLQVFCKTQKEVDYYWQKLSRGGDPKARQCGWLKDRYGLSWQVVPEAMLKMLKNSKSAGYERAFKAMLGMKKLDLARLEKAYAG
jgi:predicted 3-demethylubiquinone-9 3-methyltransferase (glyoxalase superfamily)